MAQPAHQDRGMFGKKKEDEGKQCDQTEGGRCEEGNFEEDIVLVFHRNIGLSWGDYRTKVCKNLLKVCTEEILSKLPPPSKPQENDSSPISASTNSDSDSMKAEEGVQNTNEDNGGSASLPKPRPVLPPLQVEL